MTLRCPSGSRRRNTLRSRHFRELEHTANDRALALTHSWLGRGKEFNTSTVQSLPLVGAALPTTPSPRHARQAWQAAPLKRLNSVPQPRRWLMTIFLAPQPLTRAADRSEYLAASVFHSPPVRDCTGYLAGLSVAPWQRHLLSSRLCLQRTANGPSAVLQLMCWA